MIRAPQHSGSVHVAAKSIALLPGFMLDDTLWDDFVPLLPADWNVQRIALPRGRNVHEVAQAVSVQLAGPSVILGFSMGGYVARALAAGYPQLVEALVLVATSIRKERPVSSSPDAASRVTFGGISRRAIQTALSPGHAQDRALVDRVQAMSVRLGPDEFAWQSALDRTDAPSSGVSCPTLVVAATEDRLRSIDESRELVDAIAGAQLEILEGTGHLIPLEAPKALADTLVDWLRGR